MGQFLLRALRNAAIIAVPLAFVLTGAAWALIRAARADLPQPTAMHAIDLLQDTVIVDREGRRLGAIPNGREHREVVRYADVSPYLRDAIVASEDQRFWTHHGLDAKGILRAAVATLTAGNGVQGGSTITQQLLKMTLLSSRPKVLRKIEEWMLARDFETLLTKEELLELYMNAAPLAGGNAGVEAASREFFGRSSAALSLREAALLVATIPSPGVVSPFSNAGADNLTRALQRVIRRMAETGAITTSEHARALHESVRFTLADDTPPPEVVAPVVDAAIAVAGSNLGERVMSTVDLALQQSAHDALRETLEAYARRRGEHRGSRGRIAITTCPGWIEGLPDLCDRMRMWAKDPALRLVYDLRTLAIPVDSCPRHPSAYGGAILRRAVLQGYASGIVIHVAPSSITLALGDYIGRITRKVDLAMVRPITQGFILDVQLPAVLPKDSGVTIDVTLAPRPRIDGAVVAMDPRTREVLALVGGLEYRRGDRNRALYARRPIGSTVKPFALGAALAFGTIALDGEVDDVPIRYTDPWSGEVWTPGNWYPGHLGRMPVARAIAHSVNAASVAATLATGSDRVASFLDVVGFPRPVPPHPALALGTMELTPLELANAYATLASRGESKPARLVREVVQRGAAIAEPADSTFFVLDPAFVSAVDWLLRQPIEHPDGTAKRLARLGFDLRGKTGTTNGSRDAWFVGYTPELVVAVWVGYDEPAPIRTSSGDESGATLAVPIAERVFVAAAMTRTISRATPMPEPPAFDRVFGPDAPASVRAFLADARGGGER